MKVKMSQFQKQLQEALTLYIVKNRPDEESHEEHEEGETEEEEEEEHHKEDPRDDWRKTGKYIYDEAEEIDPTVDPERDHYTGKYVFGDEDQETFTKLQNDKITMNKDTTFRQDEAEECGDEEEMDEAGPEGKGWEKVVKGIKKSKNVDNPWAVANWMKSQGYKPKSENVQESKKSDKKRQKQEDLYKWSLGWVFKQRESDKKAKKENK